MSSVVDRAIRAVRLMAVGALSLAAVGLAVPRRVLSQEATLSGQVTNESGASISLASVYLSGLGLGTQTNPDGRYAFTVPGARANGQTARLAVRAIGYVPDSVQVTLTPGVLTQDFVLKANPLQLGQVVITGAGTFARTEALGTAQHAIGDSLIVKSAEPNVVEALAGKAPNVEITNSEGSPGAGSYIRIRGIRTLSGSGQPLFVVDGVAINNSSQSTESLNPTDAPLTILGPSQDQEGATFENRLIDLNPSDIDDVQILSGGASASIYGARGGQGVVLITTKHGKAGGTRFSLQSNESLDQLSNMYKLQTQYGQGDVGVTVDPTTCNAGANSPGTCFRSWGGLLPAGTPVFDHANEAIRLGWTVNNTLSASGGNDRTTYYASGSFLSQNGVFVGPSNRFNRYAFRLNATHQISSAFKVAGNATFAYSDGAFQQRGNNTNGTLIGLLRSPPEFNNFPYLVDGQQRGFLLQNPGPSDVLTNRQFDNPFFSLYENHNTSQVGRFFGNSDVTWTPIGWLTFDYTLGGDYSTDQRYEGIPIGSSSPAVGGRVVDGRFTNFQIEQSVTGSVRYTLSSAFNGVLTAGWDLNSVHQNISGAVGRNLVATSPLLLSNASQIDLPPIDADTTLNTQSFFGQASLNAWDQLFLSAALRRDGSSAFDSAHRYSWFPKGSVAWTFTKSLLPHSSVLTFGKLRAAYGQSGQVPQAYLVGTTYSSALFPGPTQGTGLTPVGYNGSSGLASNIFLAASELREERTTEGEVGFDLGLINDRADLGVTYYNSRTDGVILAVPIAPSTGFQQSYANGAKFQNTGGEATLNIRPITLQNFAWDVGLQAGINRSKDVRLAGCTNVGCNYSLQDDALAEEAAIPGQPIGVFYDFGWAKCGITAPSSVSDPAFATSCAGKRKGTLYIDATGFPVNDLTQRVSADPNPRWTGSIRSGVRIYNIRLSALVDIRHGGTMLNGTKSSLISYGTLAATVPRATCTTRATADCTGNTKVFGTPGFYPGPVTGPGAGMAVPIGENWYRSGALGPACAYTVVYEPCMEDGGFTKLREVSIAYTFNEPFLRRIGFASMDVRLYGRNLATITNYDGLDPESNLSQVSLVRGADYYQLPQNRSYGISIGLNR